MGQAKLRQQSLPQSSRMNIWLLSVGMCSLFLIVCGAMEQTDSALLTAFDFKSLSTSYERSTGMSRTYARLIPSPSSSGRDSVLGDKSRFGWGSQRPSGMSRQGSSIEFPFGVVSGSLDAEKRPARVWEPKNSPKRLAQKMKSAVQDAMIKFSKHRYRGGENPVGANPSWESVMLIDSPEAAQRYVDNFDPDIFTTYIKRKAFQNQRLNPMYQLATASKQDYTIEEIKTRIFVLQPFEAGDPELFLVNSRALQAANPGMEHVDNRQEEIKIRKILTELIPSYFKTNSDESQSHSNEWKFYKALVQHLEDSEMVKYDHMAIHSFVRELFQRVKPESVRVDNSLSDHIQQSIPEILAARLHRPYKKSVQSIDDNLYIRQALGSLHTFILKHPGSKRPELSETIKRFYHVASLRHSNSPDIVWLVKKLQDEYDALSPTIELTRGRSNM